MYVRSCQFTSLPDKIDTPSCTRHQWLHMVGLFQGLFSLEFTLSKIKGLYSKKEVMKEMFPSLPAMSLKATKLFQPWKEKIIKKQTVN